MEQVFEWNDTQSEAAILLAKGVPKKTIYEQLGIGRTTLWRWEQLEVFSEEVTRLKLMFGLASKARRMQIINEAIQQFVDEDTGKWDVSGFTMLDLIKEARMQMEGVNLNVIPQLAAFLEQTGSVDNGGTGSSLPAIEAENPETD